MTISMGKSDIAMINVTVVLLNSGLPSTAIGPVEVFQCAGRLWNIFAAEEPRPFFDVTTASVDGAPVECDAPMVISTVSSIDEIDKTDLVFVPTGGIDVEAMLDRHEKLIPWLRHQHDSGATIALVCTGVAFAAAAGLLDGRRATTHWAAAKDYARLFPNVFWQPEFIVTEHDRILCGGGVYSAVDLALYLVEKFCGHQAALDTARALLIDMPRTYQSGYAVLPISRPHEDGPIRSAEEWIQQNFARQIRFEEVASRLGMSPRNFARRFKAATGKLPNAYLQELRVSAARARLEGDASRSTLSVAMSATRMSVFSATCSSAIREWRRRITATASAQRSRRAWKNSRFFQSGRRTTGRRRRRPRGWIPAFAGLTGEAEITGEGRCVQGLGALAVQDPR